MGGVSPVGAGAHGLGLPAASSCRLLFDQLTPLELRPDTHTSFPEAQIMQNTREILSHKRVNGEKKTEQTAESCAYGKVSDVRKKPTHFLAGVPPNCRSDRRKNKSNIS